ncbi:hypothetical protein Tco_0193989 [Tanacetum coccineum]
MLKVAPWKGVIRFRKRGKLNPRYIGPFRIIERIGPVAYRLELPQELSRVHNVFHVCNLKKCLSDDTLIIPLEEIQLDDKLNFVEEPVEIMNREVKQLKRSRIPIIKVRWNARQFKEKYPCLFTNSRSTTTSIGIDIPVCLGIWGISQAKPSFICVRIMGSPEFSVRTAKALFMWYTVNASVFMSLGHSIKNVMLLKSSALQSSFRYLKFTYGDDEVELIDEESSYYDDGDEVAKIFRIEVNVFDFKTPLCRAFKEFNYLLQIDPDVLTKDIDGIKTYEEYKDDWIYEWNKDVPWVHKRPWTENGVWKEPTPVKHHCKPFNYKSGYSLVDPTVVGKDDGYCNEGNLTGAYIIGNILIIRNKNRYSLKRRFILVVPGMPKLNLSRNDLAAKKSTKLVKYQSSGILCVIELDLTDLSGTLKVDHGTDAMTVVLGKEKGGYARGVGNGVTYKRNFNLTQSRQASDERIFLLQSRWFTTFGESLFRHYDHPILLIVYPLFEEEKAQKRGKVLTETASMVVGYTEEIVHDFEQRLEAIFGRQVNRVHILDFEGLTPDMRKDLAEKEMDGLIMGRCKRYLIGDAMRLDVAGTLCFQLGGARRRRKQGAMIFGGQFVARLVKHFGLLTEERLKGYGDLSRPPEPRGPAKQEGDAGGFTEEALVAPGGGDEDEEMPQTGQSEVLDSMASDFSRFTTWTITSLARLMDRAGVPYTRYSESSVEYQRCTRQRTDGANTSTALQQPDL